MADDVVKRLLIEQRKRLVASVLGSLETSSAWSRLPEPERRQLREKVLSSIGTYHDFCLDVVKVGSEDSVRNDEALGLIQQVHASQARIERQQRLGAVSG